MVVISHGREVEVLVAGSRKASAVGAYHNAVAKALGGNDVPLKTLSGLTVDTFELETDVEVLQELGDRFELDFDSIYSLSR